MGYERQHDIMESTGSSNQLAKVPFPLLKNEGANDVYISEVL